MRVFLWKFPLKPWLTCFILKGQKEVLCWAWHALWNRLSSLAAVVTLNVRRRFLNLSRRNGNIEDGEYEMAKRPQILSFTDGASRTSPAWCFHRLVVDVKRPTSLFQRVHTVSISVFLAKHSEMDQRSHDSWAVWSPEIHCTKLQAPLNSLFSFARWSFSLSCLFINHRFYLFN